MHDVRHGGRCERSECCKPPDVLDLKFAKKIHSLPNDLYTNLLLEQLCEIIGSKPPFFCQSDVSNVLGFLAEY